MKVAASMSGANTADRRTDREKDLKKVIGYALFRTTVGRLKHDMDSTESGVKVHFKLRRLIAVERFEFRDGEDIAGFFKTCTILLAPT